jgi:hypothetical protein
VDSKRFTVETVKLSVLDDESLVKKIIPCLQGSKGIILDRLIKKDQR